jgi:hypothetical protein
VVIPVKGLVIRRPLHLQKLQSKTPSPAMIQFLKLLHTHAFNLGSYGRAEGIVGGKN